MRSKIDTVIWDADNTLWDWTQMHLAGMRAMSQKISQITEIPEEEVKKSMARVYAQAKTFDYKALVQEMDVVQEWASRIQPEREKIKKVVDMAFAVHTAYTHSRKRTFRTYDQVPETLQRLHDASVRNVVLSDAPIGKIIRRVKTFGLEPYLDLICGQDDPLVEEEKRQGAENLQHYENIRRADGVYSTSVPSRVLSRQRKPNVDLASLLGKTPEEVMETVGVVGDNFERDIGTAYKNKCHGFLAYYGAADRDSVSGLHEFAPPDVVARNAVNVDLSHKNHETILAMGHKMKIIYHVREVLAVVLREI